MIGENLQLLFFATLLFSKVPRNMCDSQGTTYYHVAHQKRHGVQKSERRKNKLLMDLPVNSACMKNTALYSLFIFH